MPDFLFPTSEALQEIAQELVPRLEAARPVFQSGMFPIVSVDTWLLEWEQMDRFVGLQQVRGLDGEPNRVKPVGAKRYMMEPGVYGEFSLISERDLTQRRPYGSRIGAIDITDLVLERQNQLLTRRYDRLEAIVWTLLATGTFSVADGATVLHTDSYTTQTYSAAVPWGTSATATPLADMRAVQLKSRGYSVDFGSRAQQWMNRTTFNQLLSNTNAADLGGRRGPGLETINGPDAVNRVLAADDLPQIVIYDQGYLDEAGTFQLFIPNNTVIYVGARRDNNPVGEYRMVRNANNPDLAPGAYMKTIDRGESHVPRTVEVHDGHSGGPVLFYPSAVVVATV